MIQITTTWAQVSAVITVFVAVMGAFLYHFERRFQDLRDHLEVRFDAIDKRLDSIERRIERLESVFIHK